MASSKKKKKTTKKTTKRVRPPKVIKDATNNYGVAVDALGKELNALLTEEMSIAEFSRRQVKFGDRLMFTFSWRMTRLAASKL